jgi:Family of unknown function (DUF5675)
MNLQLTRARSDMYGIFGVLCDETGATLCLTLEHAYQDTTDSSSIIPDNYVPKLAVGTYICKKGMHQLKNGIKFETFEVLGVPDFQGSPVTGILFHIGNYNKDSEGCILLGSEIAAGCLVNSGVAFTSFASLQSDVDEFTLIVS